MKNIHVIPTDKLSRLAYYQESTSYNKPVLQLVSATSSDYKYQNICITNSEEIKEGDYCIDDRNSLNKIINVSDNGYLMFENGNSVKNTKCKKIILTTDELYIHNDLIPKEYNTFPQYIQKIDDEFLEWFVAHPSCEEVEVETYLVRSRFIWRTDYRIIIPKEEPKQIYYNTVGRENGVFVIKGQFNTQKEALDLANELNEKGLGVYYDWNETLVKEEPKQETLEEAKERYLDSPTPHSYRLAVEFGAKWRQERSYSEEDMNKYADYVLMCSAEKTFKLPLQPKEWFEQFKKK